MPASARRLWITEGTVEKHVHSILTKLRLARDRRRPPPGARGGHVPRRSSDRLCSSTRSGGEHPSDRRRRQLRLRKKSDGRTRLDQVGVLGFVVGGDQDHVGDRSPDPAARAAGVASSSPLSPPRSMSISATSGRSSAICRSASAADAAPPTTSRPCSASRAAHFLLGSSRCHRRSGSANGMALARSQEPPCRTCVLAPKPHVCASQQAAHVR